MTNKDKTQFTLRLREDIHNKIKIISEKNKRSLTMQIEHLLEQYIEQYEKENGTIEVNK